MTVRVENLLDVMNIRYSMQNEGLTTPSQHVKDVTKTMIDKLSRLEKSEEIEIMVFEQEPLLHSKYVRKLTGEILAEKQEPIVIILDE